MIVIEMVVDECMYVMCNQTCISFHLLIFFAMGDDFSYGLNTLGPLCLWQCLSYIAKIDNFEFAQNMYQVTCHLHQKKKSNLSHF